MKDVLDLKLKFGIYCLILVLVEWGFICRLVYRVWVIEVVWFFDDVVNDLCVVCFCEKGFCFSVIEGDFGYR